MDVDTHRESTRTETETTMDYKKECSRESKKEKGCLESHCRVKLSSRTGEDER